MTRGRWWLALALGLLVASCARSRPRDIAYGSEACSHCHMTIADPRFSAELLTPTGKAITFDDIGCMATWLAEHAGEAGEAWVVSLTDGQWIRADSATFLKSSHFHTPMSSSLVAFRTPAEADSVRVALGGEVLGWPAVRQLRGHREGTH